MLRTAAVVIVSSLLFIPFTATSDAAPFTHAFDALNVELQQRRDNDYAGVLDKAHKAALKGIVGSIKAIGRNSKSFAADLTTGFGVAKTLEKALPGETGRKDVTLPVALRVLLETAFADLRLPIQTRRDELAARLAALSVKGAANVGKSLAKADGALVGADAAVTFDALAKLLTAADKAIGKGTHVADKDKGPGGGGGGGGGGATGDSITVNGVHWSVATHASTYFRDATFALAVSFNGGSPQGQIDFVPFGPIPSTGTYQQFSCLYSVGSPPTKFYQGDAQGTLVITTLESAGAVASASGRVGGSFTVDVFETTTGEKLTIAGTFDIKKMIVL